MDGVAVAIRGLLMPIIGRCKMRSLGRAHTAAHIARGTQA
jgi:hypothetical protein